MIVTKRYCDISGCNNEVREDEYADTPVMVVANDELKQTWTELQIKKYDLCNSCVNKVKDGRMIRRKCFPQSEILEIDEK
jgi:hypothetical protein